jgi:3-isopropylmalate/(R)-2-methylmalate dehydratase large subunit
MATARPQTLAQKLVARAARRDDVLPGEVVSCEVDLAMFHDSSGPRRLAPMLAELGAKLLHPERLVLVLDHYLPEADDESRRIVRIAREWAREQQLPHVHDGIGICHVVLPQQGHLRPGLFVVGGDSHTPTAGAFGTYAFGVGATEMLGVVTTGQTWLQVPSTVFIRLDGLLRDGITAKDVMLHLIGRLGLTGAGYQAVEYQGDAARAMPMDERMTLSNMSAELGAQVGLVAPDATTQAWLAEHGVVVTEEDLQHWRSDPGSAGTQHVVDATELGPQVARPHSPALAGPVAALEKTRIDVAYIGACTGAKLSDLRAAARVLKGQRIATGVNLLVAPASLKDQQQAEREGVMQALVDAGAQVLATSCGACAGYGGAIDEGRTVISSTARNFKGRMGAATAEVYLASPYTVAASALQGHIADPREMLAS